MAGCPLRSKQRFGRLPFVPVTGGGDVPASRRVEAMNIEKYTERTRGFIQSAQALALSRGHQQFLPLHILKVLVDDPEGMAAGLIERAGGNAQAVRAGVEEGLKKIPSA